MKKIRNTDVYKGTPAIFTGYITGKPLPTAEWYKNGNRLFPTERIRMTDDDKGLVRLTIDNVKPEDAGKYSCKISNPNGEDICFGDLTVTDPDAGKRKKPGEDEVDTTNQRPAALLDRPVISNLTERRCVLSWKPYVPFGLHYPCTYNVEMCEVPDGEWRTIGSKIRGCRYEIRDLEPNRDYRFRVRVENKYGLGEPSPYAQTNRSKIVAPAGAIYPYLVPGIDFRPKIPTGLPKDFDIERPPHDRLAQAPVFLKNDYPVQYGIRDHNTKISWFVYGYPKPTIEYYYKGNKIDPTGHYSHSYTRNGEATLFLKRMKDGDVGEYTAVARNEHGEAKQSVELAIAEHPRFIQRPEETYVMSRRSGRIEARITGIPYPQIKWFKDWQPLAETSRIKVDSNFYCSIFF